MGTRTGSPSAGSRSLTERVVGVVTLVFWASAALMAVLVMLSGVAPALRDGRSFLVLGGVAVGVSMVTSAFLFWREIRVNRQEMYAARRESRDIPLEEGAEWTPGAWLYGLAFALSFFVSWYLLPALMLS